MTSKNIHPANKQDVAKRLANWALAKTYGRKGIAYQSPVYRSMAVEGSKIRIHFDYAEEGLQANNGEPTDFFIAGADQQFVPAKATIEGGEVVVSSEKSANLSPSASASATTAIPNLFSKAGAAGEPVPYRRLEVETEAAGAAK